MQALHGGLPQRLISVQGGTSGWMRKNDFARATWMLVIWGWWRSMWEGEGADGGGGFQGWSAME